MLKTLESIFSRMEIETPQKQFIKIHSNTSKEQGLFLQQIFDLIKPSQSLEVGLAFGISAMFLLEKHKEKNSLPKSHIIIEPYPWNGVAEYNIGLEKLGYLTDIYYKRSDIVLPKLSEEKKRIQFAYIDTTKLFDVVMQDIYFIDKMLDVNGVLILDDCGGVWPGVQKAARFLNTLPHYKFFGAHGKSRRSFKRKVAESIHIFFSYLIPFKSRFLQGKNLRTDNQLNLEYSCIAFKKISEDKRNWDWDMPF